MTHEELTSRYFKADREQKQAERAELELNLEKQRQEVNNFLASLANKDEFIFRLVFYSKAFINYQRKHAKKTANLFSAEELMRTPPANALF